MAVVVGPCERIKRKSCSRRGVLACCNEMRQDCIAEKDIWTIVLAVRILLSSPTVRHITGNIAEGVFKKY